MRHTKEEYKSQLIQELYNTGLFSWDSLNTLTIPELKRKVSRERYSKQVAKPKSKRGKSMSYAREYLLGMYPQNRKELLDMSEEEIDELYCDIAYPVE